MRLFTRSHRESSVRHPIPALVAGVLCLALLVACGGGSSVRPGGAPAGGNVPATGSAPATGSRSTGAAPSGAGAPSAAQASPASGGTGGAAPAAAPKPAAPAAAAPPKNLGKVAVVDAGTGLIYVPAGVALAKGYFKQEGLDVEITAAGTGTDATAAVVGGSAQFATASISHVVQAVEGGLPLVALAPAATEYALAIVISKEAADKAGVTLQSPLADRLKAVKGLKIGISSPGASTDKFIRYLATQGGLNPDKDLQLVPLGGIGPTRAAFKERKVDAFVRSSPDPEAAAIMDNGIVLVAGNRGEIEAMKGFQYTVYLTTRDFAKQKPDVVQAFVNGLTRAMFLTRDKGDEASAVYKEQRGKNVEAAIWNESWKNNLPAIAKDPIISQDNVKVTFNILKVVEGQEVKIKYEDVVDPSYAEKAKAALKDFKP
ncbi:MAG: ABC transporter substrate-binding protein [Chloroflexi bacterium]|nr:ABC transporter substrate-binding protein [Chloroflexota bacterium]